MTRYIANKLAEGPESLQEDNKRHAEEQPTEITSPV
jgi:hypothetical protein